MTSPYQRRRAQESCVRNFRTHGLSSHPLYEIWRGVLRRCGDENSRSYGNYGGRGITMDAAWAHLPMFIFLVELEIGPRPSPKHSLDRIDYNLGYGHTNIRWATPPEQARNRRARSRRDADHDGQRHCLCHHDCRVAGTCDWDKIPVGPLGVA